MAKVLLGLRVHSMLCIYHAKFHAEFQLARMFLVASIAKLLSVTRFANSHSSDNNLKPKNGLHLGAPPEVPFRDIKVILTQLNQ